ncbi:MAG: hypothetical protein IPN85_18285 [Flavobacteriales bacterium]|nr:hypothetical protein [Flavobacteriales bacterium]
MKDGRDARTGLPLMLLYGDNKKPKPGAVERCGCARLPTSRTWVCVSTPTTAPCTM